MLSRRLYACLVALTLFVPLSRSNGQEPRAEPRPRAIEASGPIQIEVRKGFLEWVFEPESQPGKPDAAKKEPKPADNKAEAAESLKELEQLLKKHPSFGGKIQLHFDVAKPPEAKPADPASQLEKALKQLTGPADQLDLREVRKLVTAALGELRKPTPQGPGNRMLPQGGLPLNQQAPPGMGWGGPGSSPWMPGMPGGAHVEIVPEAQAEIQKKIKILLQNVCEARETHGQMNPQAEQALKKLEEARAQLERLVKEKKSEPQKAIVATFSFEPANENLTLTRRAGRYVARLIEPGVRITVTGSTRADPATAGIILIEAGDDVASYEGINAVPMRYRPQVGRLLDLAKR